MSADHQNRVSPDAPTTCVMSGQVMHWDDERWVHPGGKGCSLKHHLTADPVTAPDMVSVIVSPDCRDRNHQKCPGDAWDEAHDHPAECECECHGGPVGAEHFPLCPCGACQAVRAARPEPPTPVGWWPCCGATFQTLPYRNEYIGTGKHSAHCPQAVSILLPKEGS